ncbi:RNA polymerase sigma factor [Sinomicrobium sp.]
MKADFRLDNGRSQQPGQEGEYDSDTELWSAFQEGSRRAFEQIYRQNEERLFYYGMKVVADENSVWDAVQDLFLNLWNKRSGIGEVRVIRSYLYKSLRNRLIRTVSHGSKTLSLEEETPGDTENRHISLGISDKEENEERETRIRKVLSILSARQQELIYLRFYEGLSVDEIVGITGMKRRTIYHHLSGAIEVLKGLGKDVFLFVVLSMTFGRI